jgi:hypothetical protein
VVQLAGVVEQVRRTPDADEVIVVAQDELAAFGAAHGPPLFGHCAAIELFGAAARSRPGLLLSRVGADVCLAVVGTSWTEEAGVQLRERGRTDGAFLLSLGAEGRAAARRIDAIGDETLGLALAFAEITRGALLGLAMHLDASWPTPLRGTALGDMDFDG